jgi:hypothetical protein
MSHKKKSNLKAHKQSFLSPKKNGNGSIVIVSGIIIGFVTIYLVFFNKSEIPKPAYLQKVPSTNVLPMKTSYQPTEKWLKRAYEIDESFHAVYTPCWEGASGAIGDAYLYAVTKDSTLLRFHAEDHDLKRMCVGTWVDDRAWVCLAELIWWEFTGKTNMLFVADAVQRYNEAREQGRLSNHEGYWTWYNYPPNAHINEKIFTNSAMNQMVNVACRLYLATHDKKYLKDALLVWNGDGKNPGIEKMLYHGNGIWKGKEGMAAFGKELGWSGTEYCAIGAALYRATGDTKYKRIVVATAKYIMDPNNGWVDKNDFYQIHMDGNGAFVNYLLSAYLVAPSELKEIPTKVERMLEHVWTNNHGHAALTLHRESDHGIRNGWNPSGGEDGYGVDQVGTVHAQSQALWAFGMFAYVKNVMTK